MTVITPKIQSPASDDGAVLKADQPKRKLTHSEIVEHLRSKHRVSPEIQQLVEASRRKCERERDAFRAVARDIIEAFKQQMASALKLDLHAFAQIPDDVLDQLHAASQTAKALDGVPGTKINVTFTSEVTVNGVRVPDEE